MRISVGFFDLEIAMAVGTRTENKLVCYCSLGGFMFFMSDVDILNEAKQEVVADFKDLDIGKQTFTGAALTEPSGLLLKKCKGIRFDFVSGIVAGVKIHSAKAESGDFDYLQILLKDQDQSLILSLPFGSVQSIRLLAKLAEIDVHREVNISLYATRKKSESDGKFYTDHAVSLRQFDKEVKAPGILKTLSENIRRAYTELEKNGKVKTNTKHKDFFTAERKSVQFEYAEEILSNVKQLFKNEASRADVSPHENEDDHPESGFPGMEDDTPF
jgi:hypothetical protein